MDEPLGGVARFFRELKRRHVDRVAGPHVAPGFALHQPAGLILGAYKTALVRRGGQG